jgi:hypothetical protein
MTSFKGLEYDARYHFNLQISPFPFSHFVRRRSRWADLSAAGLTSGVRLVHYYYPFTTARRALLPISSSPLLYY